ncbi:MAG: type VII toxin-antitoxin system HepT family RNase toxin [Planctomycetota bacterium]|jgi:uncharacterized protein YutE (UPF0331/DUF86 family)
MHKILENKIESLRRCIDRIKSKTPASAEMLSKDFDVQDIISINLERSIQLCVDMSAVIIAEKECDAASTMGEGFDRLFDLGVITQELSDRMKKAVGFRNISVHAYQKIDWDVVYSIITKNISDFTEFALAVSKVR